MRGLLSRVSADSGCSRRSLVLALVIVSIGVAAPRLLSWHHWTSAPEEHFAGEVVVASMDSYLWLRVAEQIRQGTWDAGEPDRLRYFPDGVSSRRLALMPQLLAFGADLAGTSVHRAGLVISLLLAVVFVLPMGLFFARCGLPLVGLVGAALAGLSPAYLPRTWPYRVDTDGGNLFFVWLTAYTLLGVLRSRTAGERLLFALATGLASAGFASWYAQPGFVWVIGGALLLCCAHARLDLRSSLGVLALYALCADPSALAIGAADLQEFVRGYLLGETGAAGSVAASFPSPLDEIQELARLPFAESLARLQRPWPLALLGLLGLVPLALRLRGAVLALLPGLLLAALGLFESKRFLMYLAPFQAAGVGALLWLVLRGRVPSFAGQCGAGLLLVALCLPGTAAFDEPRPHMHVARLRALQDLAGAAPEGAVALAPWHDGYPLTGVAGLATFNDGQLPDPVVEQLVCLALVSPEPVAIRAVATYLAAHSRAELHTALERAGSQRALVAELASDSSPAPTPLVVVMTRDTQRFFGHVIRKGYWDFERRQGMRAAYDTRECQETGADTYRCARWGYDDVSIDVARGTLNGQESVSRFVRVRDGTVVEEHDFGRKGMVLQLLESPASPHALHVLNEVVFHTNFNQMFVLGRYDASLFEPLSAALPELRAYLLVAAEPGP